MLPVPAPTSRMRKPRPAGNAASNDWRVACTNRLSSAAAGVSVYRRVMRPASPAGKSSSTGSCKPRSTSPNCAPHRCTNACSTALVSSAGSKRSGCVPLTRWGAAVACTCQLSSAPRRSRPTSANIPSSRRSSRCCWGMTPKRWPICSVRHWAPAVRVKPALAKAARMYVMTSSSSACKAGCCAANVACSSVMVANRAKRCVCKAPRSGRKVGRVPKIGADGQVTV